VHEDDASHGRRHPDRRAQPAPRTRGKTRTAPTAWSRRSSSIHRRRSLASGTTGTSRNPPGHGVPTARDDDPGAGGGRGRPHRLRPRSHHPASRAGGFPDRASGRRPARDRVSIRRSPRRRRRRRSAPRRRHVRRLRGEARQGVLGHSVARFAGREPGRGLRRAWRARGGRAGPRTRPGGDRRLDTVRGGRRDPQLLDRDALDPAGTRERRRAAVRQPGESAPDPLRLGQDPARRRGRTARAERQRLSGVPEPRGAPVRPRGRDGSRAVPASRGAARGPSGSRGNCGPACYARSR
jgi:hypothetical protein